MAVPLIQFNDVKKSFNDVAVLNGINLSVFRGEITAVIGKSGTGKSVLLKHIIGLIAPDSGQILIEGEPLSTLSRHKKKRFQKRLSYMFQDNALFDFMDIYHNISLPLAEDSEFPNALIRDRVIQLTEQLGVSDALEKYPAQLSGGMRKRVALARALVTDPEIVLFDEPTTGLDPVRKKNVHKMITEHQEEFGFTAVIVSHDIPEIFNIAQRIAMLDNGAIQFEGSKKELLNAQHAALNAFVNGEEL